MKIIGGSGGLEGLGFTSTEEVYLVTDAAVYSRRKPFIDGVFEGHGFGRLGGLLEWLAEKTPKAKGFHNLEVLGQQAILNSKLVGQDREAYLDLTWSSKMSHIALSALRQYAVFLEGNAYSGSEPVGDDARERLELAKQLVDQTKGTSD